MYGGVFFVSKSLTWPIESCSKGRKTKSKVFTLANHKGHAKPNETIKTSNTCSRLKARGK